MINETLKDALNQQIKEEFNSAYLYLAMSADFEDKNLSGFAQWMKVQAKEEIGHGMKIYDFLLDCGAKVALYGIDKPQGSWDTALDAFEGAYKHERYITGCINDLVKLAKQENDYATEIFLQWFVSEQVEEEKSADGVVRKLKMIKDSANGLMMLDRALGARE